MPPCSTRDVDPRRAGIDGVLQQFLDDARRPLNHFAGGDLVDHARRVVGESRFARAVRAASRSATPENGFMCRKHPTVARADATCEQPPCAAPDMIADRRRFDERRFQPTSSRFRGRCRRWSRGRRGRDTFPRPLVGVAADELERFGNGVGGGNSVLDCLLDPLPVGVLLFAGSVLLLARHVLSDEHGEIAFHAELIVVIQQRVACKTLGPTAW